MNLKQTKFVEYYVKHPNGTQAAIKAGYAPKSARITASQLLTKPNIQALIKKKLAAIAKRNEVTEDRILKEYSRIAFLDPVSLFDDDGFLRQIQDIPEDTRRAIASLEIESGTKDEPFTNVNKIKLISKINALDSLARYAGMFKDKDQTPANYIDKIIVMPAKLPVGTPVNDEVHDTEIKEIESGESTT